MKRFYLFFVLALLASVPVSAQNSPIKGTVVNSEDNSPIVAAMVVVKGTTSGTVTDSDGNFEIQAPAGAVLQVSHLGMETQEVAVTGGQPLRIALIPSSTVFDEVVVIGYGSMKKSLVTGAISSIGAKDAEMPGLSRADELLQGKVAGVQVISNSGQPGEGLAIRIRGIGTHINPAPLYIVDGQPLDDIGFLNPRDIKQMEILKDAASSAIYGTRGANGVVIITTRTGVFDTPMHIEYDFYYGIQNLRKKMDLLDARSYAVIQNEAAVNGGQAIPFPLNEMSKLGKGTDWQESILNKNAPVMSHQLRINGGSSNNAYNISASYFEQDGIFAKDKSNFQRITLRENTDHQFKHFLKIGQTITVTHGKTQGIDPNNVWGGPILGALNMDPVTPVRNEDGTYGSSPYVAQEVVNPVARVDVTNGYDKYTKLITSAYGELTFLRDFTIRSSVASEMTFTDNWGYTPAYRLNAAVGNDVPGTHKETSWANFMTYENTLTYNKSIGRHNITAMGGNTVIQKKGNNVWASKKGLLIDSPEYAYLDLAVEEGSDRATGGAWHEALVSYFGRVNYSYDNRYLFAATFRADGSTKFGKNNRFGYFPSVSAGWNISEEKFLKSAHWLDMLKLRASWGQNGNDRIDSWEYLATIATGARGYTFGNTIYPGASPGKIANPDLKWETSEQTNIGVDFGFFNKFNVTLDYYIKNTWDLLMVAPIPAHVGAPAPYSNAGNVKNSGVEFAISYFDRKGDWRWNVDLNLAYNKNRVTSINTESGWIAGASVGTAMNNVTRMAVGEPISHFWGMETAGIFQNQAEIDKWVADGNPIQAGTAPGDFKFIDSNGDGNLDEKDRTNLGKPNPDLTGGLTVGFGWKGLDFSAFFNGMYGNSIFNATRRWDLPGSNYHQSVLDRWHGEGTSDTYPRVSATDPNRNFTTPSAFFIEDASFLRLKNVTLGYTFTGLEKIYVEKLRIYVSATNLFTLTKYTGLDPEIGTNGVLGSGIDYGIYPQPRTFNFGLTITF